MDTGLMWLAFGVLIALAFSAGLMLTLRHLKTGWQSFLLWEGMPLLFSLTFFVLITCFNWQYETKLLMRRPEAYLTLTEAYMGPILLSIAVGQSMLAALPLFVLRMLKPALYGPEGHWLTWVFSAPLSLIAALLGFGSVVIVVLGPAGITMLEQMSYIPDQRGP